MHWPGSMGGGSGTQLGGAMGGDTGSWWSLDDGPDSWRPRPAALRDLRIISLRRSLVTAQEMKQGTFSSPLSLSISLSLSWRHVILTHYVPPQGHSHTSHPNWCGKIFKKWVVCIPVIYSASCKNRITGYSPSAAGWAGPIPRAVAWNHRDGVGNCLHGR